VRQVGYLQEF